MYYYVNGTVAEIDAGLAVIDCGGVATPVPRRTIRSPS